ncbi:Major facilitator superfamily domain-containing protein 1-like [Scleropages formosus]|uniref:Lysosomal dipeptide transporter MFSD1 n=1 Tax=Scleropages formosus TaxID=113540 RepID=A0A0N8JYW5_SCLFO|nr:Major facilitator superfamily domain-containing protein 1-like [Scleropages formosus]
MAGGEESRKLMDGEEDDGDERGSGGGGSRTMAAICDPTRWPHRIIVLSLMCFLGFGSYFCYDNPSALQQQVKQDMDLNTSSFMQLYAWYSWPNVVLCFLGGFLLDRVFGIRIGGESLAVAQNTYAVNWFKGKGLNLVFGLQLSMARLGSTVNMNVMGLVYENIRGLRDGTGYTTLGITLMIAAATCVFSLICALVLGYLDRRAERILKKEVCSTGEVIKVTDVKDFPLSLWLIFIICVGYYVAIFPFIGLGQVFFIEKFNFSPVQASAINSIVYIISAPASPLLGFLVDKTGKNIIWVLMAVIVTLASHMMLAFTFWNPWIAMCLLGVSYSLLACALWPMVAFVVPEHQLGTAYGFMQSIQNLGLALIAMAAGAILDSRGYLFLEVFFCACVCIALIAVVLLYFLDLIKGGELNLSTSARARLQKDTLSHSETPRGRQSSVQEEDELSRLKPLSAFGLRNRYLSRLGAQNPSWLHVKEDK